MLEVAMLHRWVTYNGVYRPSAAYAYSYIAIPEQAPTAVDGKVRRTLVGYKVQGRAVKCAGRHVVSLAINQIIVPD